MKLISKIFTMAMLMIAMTASAQQGTMTLELVEASSDNPQVAQMTEMMKGMQTIVSYKGKESITMVDMMGGMVKMKVKVDVEENTDMLMDMMGQKIWVPITKIEADKMKAEADNPMEYTEITYDKEDKKTIAGYECYKMKVTFPDVEGATLEAYITEDLDITAPVIQGVDIKKFAGFPLEYNFNNGMMSLVFTTKSLVDTVDEGLFEFKTDGYQKMSMSEFSQLTGGMGMGF